MRQDRSRLVATLLAWGDRERRDLPWRRTRDPWEVLVSETMLQQTQVSRVVPRYDAFLQRFPTAAACAAAPPGEVLRWWDGLGYNRRAVNLHRAAAAIVADHGGRVPSRLDELVALPGVGPYIARAVLAFAFEHDHGVVDTNTVRVLARAVAGRRLGRAAAQRLADEMVPPGSAWAWNQAMLDLGAQVCRKRDPACGTCPIADQCAWVRGGREVPDPAIGSAGTGRRQSAFEGSDRRGRGRLVRALRAGPVPLTDVAGTAGWLDDPARATRIAHALVDEGLARIVGDQLVLP